VAARGGASNVPRLLSTRAKDAVSKKQLHPNAVHFTVASVARSSAFYIDKLGFKLVEAFPDKQKPVWARLLFHGQAVMLGELPSLVEARQWGMDHDEIELLKQDARAFVRGSPGAGAQYYLQVADVDVYARRLKRKRVKLLTQPKSQFYGIRDFQLQDLDGYRLVFFAPVPKSVAAPTPAPDATGP